jgi:hypothetical protein
MMNDVIIVLESSGTFGVVVVVIVVQGLPDEVLQKLEAPLYRVENYILSSANGAAPRHWQGIHRRISY